MTSKVAASGIRKTYGAVEALRGVDLEVRAGEVHAICGDNGAGKSTLIKVLSGVEQADAGEVLIDGRSCRFRSPMDALEAGVATIHQDLALAPRMSIHQNVFMGAELTRRVFGVPFLDTARMRAESLGFMSQLNRSLKDMDTAVEDLSGGQRQAVAICRALRWNADIVILDEPTAALGVRETEQVLDLIRALKRSGKTIILISHNMKDVVSVADRVTILRRGETQIVLQSIDMTAERLSRYILSGETA